VNYAILGSPKHYVYVLVWYDLGTVVYPTLLDLLLSDDDFSALVKCTLLLVVPLLVLGDMFVDFFLKVLL
jgi:hypothetical protein